MSFSWASMWEMLWKNLANQIGPSGLFFPPYIISAVLIGVYWLSRTEKLTWRKSWSVAFSKQLWLASSWRQDLGLNLLNLVFFKFASRWLNILAFGGAFGLVYVKNSLPLVSTFPIFAEAILVTGLIMLAIDFASYWSHRILHIRAMWWIHSVHHGAEQLTPLTTHRQHPLEPIFLRGCRGAAAGLTLGILYRIFPNQTPIVTVAEMGVGFFIYMFTVHLHHFAIPVCFPRVLRWVLMSPHCHHLHHSTNPRHHGRNFGVIFSVWDRCFGTYHDEPVTRGELTFGHSASQSLANDRPQQRPASGSTISLPR